MADTFSNRLAGSRDMTKENIKLLTVEDAFLIEGRGVLVMPMITNYRGPTSFYVVLRKPNGEESLARAHLDIPRLNPAQEPFPFACCLTSIEKQEVPVSTEIWITNESVATHEKSSATS
ncbi:MAG TPA: hypothetical protein VNX46_05400 [Candidatus Acidoferrum sp.]|jgi:hypothetical protein|nr:hypothetical protein [Candidatus Acidoferrum sp.]